MAVQGGDAMSSFHQHMPHARQGRYAGGAKGLIGLLILLHLGFIVYWGE